MFRPTRGPCRQRRRHSTSICNASRTSSKHPSSRANRVARGLAGFSPRESQRHSLNSTMCPDRGNPPRVRLPNRGDHGSSRYTPSPATDRLTYSRRRPGRIRASRSVRSSVSGTQRPRARSRVSKRPRSLRAAGREGGSPPPRRGTAPGRLTPCRRSRPSRPRGRRHVRRRAGPASLPVLLSRWIPACADIAQRMLLAVDQSVGPDRAAELAARLAAHHDGRVIILPSPERDRGLQRAIAASRRVLLDRTGVLPETRGDGSCARA